MVNSRINIQAGFLPDSAARHPMAMVSHIVDCRSWLKYQNIKPDPINILSQTQHPNKFQTMAIHN